MKWSNYNLMWESAAGRSLLYNSLSNTFAAAEPALAGELEKIRQDPDAYDFTGNPTLLLQLRRAKILVEDGEERDLLNLNLLNRNLDNLRSNVLALTIVPTLACNFRCTYCYQQHKGPRRMTEAVQAQLLAFIQRFKLYGLLKVLDVCWFGGEPLLEFDRICRLTEDFKALEVPFKASMVTNGYLLDEERIGKLEDLKIDSIQITIDGPEEVHNRRRPHVSRGDSYGVIMANVARLLDRWPGRLALRVNVDQSNREQFFEVRSQLLARFPGKNIKIYPGIVQDGPRGNPDAPCECSSEEVADFFLKFYQEDTGDDCRDLYPNPSPCTANRRQSFVIGPEGEIYNCWHEVGKPEWVVGSIFPDREWNFTLLSRYMTGTEVFADDTCRRCFFLPRCSGGCPHFRARRLFQGEDFDTCLRMKSRFTEFLELRYQKKHQGNSAAKNQ
ncbi:MAG: radical SAM protein [Syntrophales bacterium]|nr:radical SAM protein [Syntrophales bacterium]MDD5640198.1 radical SAM protein [Syntrophales bacterium]